MRFDGKEIWDGEQQLGIFYPSSGKVNLFEHAESRRAEIESFARAEYRAPEDKIPQMSEFEKDRELEER